MKIKLYRVVLNVLFYIFYVLLASVVFSFIFPTILVILGQDVIAPNNPIFDFIQIIIIILVGFFSLLLRKYFYLPIREKSEIIDNKQGTKEELSEELELDIKVGKEIK